MPIMISKTPPKTKKGKDKTKEMPDKKMMAGGKKVGRKKKGIGKKIGMGLTALELPLMAEFYSDIGTGVSPRALELMQGLGLMKKGKKVGGKGRMSEFDKMVKDLKLSPDEIADMLGLTKMDPKTGVRRKAGGTVKLKEGGRSLGRAKPLMEGPKPRRKKLPAKPSGNTMTYKKYLAKKNPSTKNMSSGKRVGTPRGCGAAMRGYGKAMKRGK